MPNAYRPPFLYRPIIALCSHSLPAPNMILFTCSVVSQMKMGNTLFIPIGEQPLRILSRRYICKIW